MTKDVDPLPVCDGILRHIWCDRNKITGPLACFKCYKCQIKICYSYTMVCPSVC